MRLRTSSGLPNPPQYPASWVAMVRAALAGAYSSDHGLCVVDVRDLAAAHTLAVVHPEAYGRWVWVKGMVCIREDAQRIGVL